MATKKKKKAKKTTAKRKVVKKTTKRIVKKKVAKKSAEKTRKVGKTIVVARKLARPVVTHEKIVEYMGPKVLSRELVSMRRSIMAHARERRARIVARMKREISRLKDERQAFAVKIAERISLTEIAHRNALHRIREKQITAIQRLGEIKRAMKEHRAKMLMLKSQERAGSHRGAVGRAEMIDRTRKEVAATHPDLLPFFESVKMRLRNRPKLSAFEQFLQLVHDSPDAAMRASIVASDRKVAELIRQGERSWESRVARVENAICARAHKLANKGLPFRLKDSEAKLLAKAGYDVEELEMRCYKPTKRIVSKRGAVRPERAPF